MAQVSSAEIVFIMASEIGPEASLLRKGRDRLYLSGIDIASLVATGVLVSFLTGLFNGIKKGLIEHGEELGKAVVDAVATRLKTLLKKVYDLAGDNPKEINKQIRSVHNDLDEIVDLPGLRGMATQESMTLRSIQLTEVTTYLVTSGYPKDEVHDRAEALILVIRRELTTRR